MMLGQTGLLGMIGKSERGPETVERHSSAQSRIFDGGGRRCLSGVEAIKHARVVAFADLGMEAIYEFDVEDIL